METTDTLVAETPKDETKPVEQPKPKKWTSVAGPIQTNKVNKVLQHYSWEGNTFVELRGVHGRPETEDRSTYTLLCGSTGREDVRKAAQALGEKFDWTVTRANYRQIIDQANKDFEELKKTRPVHDKRETAEVHDQREAAWKARQESERLHAEEVARSRAQAKATAATSAGVGQTSVSGVTVSLNEALGGVEVRFPAKPALEIISRLKSKGFRWSMRSKCWYKRQSPDAIAFANSLAGDTTPHQEAPKVEEQAETPDPFDLAQEDRMAEAAGVAGEASLFGDQ